MGKKRKLVKTDDIDEDWIASLAKQSAELSSSKEERKAKRAQKKKQQAVEQYTTGDKNRAVQQKEEQLTKRKSYYSRKNELLLISLTEKLRDISTVVRERNGGKYQKPFSAKTVHTDKTRKRRWEERSIQPRHCDYGGIGLARPSLFLSMDDPSFFPKLEEEFAEHIPGFFGKQRTKAMKKQLGSNMLWRQLAEKKNNLKINGKRLSEMSPDERVEAMLKAGMV